MKRFKVLHVHTLPVISGSGINTYLTMKGTPADRYETALACAGGGKLNTIVREAGMAVHEVPNLVQPLRPHRDLMALLHLVRLLRRQEIDIVHTHNSKAGFLGRLAGRLAGTPVIIHTVHGFAFHRAEAAWRRLLFRTLERMAAPWADHTILISQPMIDWARREGILVPGRYSKIYSGIDLQSFRRSEEGDFAVLRRELGLQAGDRVIGFVSKLWEGKGHVVALRAMVRVTREVPRARLLLVGEGPLEPQLRSMVRDLGLDRFVIFGGFRTRIAELTSLCEFCILPSFFEGMGRVLLEAGACGRPAVASDVGGIPDVVEEGVTGLLVPPGDAESLADAMLRLLQDRELAHRMGRAARARITARFDAGTMVREILSVYEDCLRRKGRLESVGAEAPRLGGANRRRKVG